jgi:hypothetical protein
MELMYENLARERAIARDPQALHLMAHRRAIAARRAQLRSEGAVGRVRRLLSLVAVH